MHKKSLLELQYIQLLKLYRKLQGRLNRHFSAGRFHRMSESRRTMLLSRVTKLKEQLLRLEGKMKLAGLAMALGTVLHSEPALAQATKQGSEFLVNTYTTNYQRFQSIAMDSDGDFVMVWNSLSQDGSNYGIYGQRYNASGVSQGMEFRVNTYTTNAQNYPSVAMDSDGDFVVVWQSNNQDGAGYGIYGQKYNASGVAQGSEFKINTNTTYDQNYPSVAMDSDGDFVVVWEVPYQTYGYPYGIYGQRYNASGVAQGGEFKVNTFIANNKRRPSIAMDSDGDFVVVWESGNQDGSNYGIYGQRYNASGVAQGGEFQVNTYTTSYQQSSFVAMDSDGDFVVTWHSYGQDGDKYGVYGQRYNATGVSQGSEFKINTYTTDEQRYPSIAMDSDGDFVVVWHSYYQDGSLQGIYGQGYNATGVARGSEFRVNTYTTNNQNNPSVAIDSDGDFIVGWNSNQDGSNYGVYGQRYKLNTITSTSPLLGMDGDLLSFYPSPAKDLVFVNVEDNSEVKITDLTGKPMLNTKIENQHFNILGLKAGIYVLEINQEGKKGIYKLVVE